MSWLQRIAKHPKDRKWVRLWHVGPDRITKFHANPIHRESPGKADEERGRPVGVRGVYFAPHYRDVGEWARWAARGKCKNLFLTEVRVPAWLLGEARKRVQRGVDEAGLKEWPLSDSEVFIPDELLDHVEIVGSKMYEARELEKLNRLPGGRDQMYVRDNYRNWLQFNPMPDQPAVVQRNKDLERLTPDSALPWADPEWLAEHPYKEQKSVDPLSWRRWDLPQRYHGRKNKGSIGER